MGHINIYKIDRVSVWLVLDRYKKINITDGKPDINELSMLMLKNKLDAWKKEVRILGCRPIIYINYVED